MSVLLHETELTTYWQSFPDLVIGAVCLDCPTTFTSILSEEKQST